MITEPTVLILGAGASYPYGFPTAKQLKWDICDAFSNEKSLAPQLLDGKSDYSASEFSDFAMALRHSGNESVDAFLEQRQKQNERVVGVGKLAIAYALIPCEDEGKLFQRDFGSRGGHWYEYLFGRLNTDFRDFARNQLSIITFNYDRSLEHYLLTALKNTHGKDFANWEHGKGSLIAL